MILKITKTLLLFALIGSLMSAGTALEKHKLELAIERAEFVGYVEFEQNSNTPNLPWVRANEVFKAGLHRFKMQNADITMSPDTEYLVVISFRHDERIGTFMSDMWYPIKAVDALTDAELTILDNMPCFSEELRKQNSNKGCTKVYEVGADYCGCNNQTYNGLCGLQLQGYLRAKRGECP